ncbi:MAG: ORC1-type DNA replication protein [Methanosarcinales archaeon]|nr:ORC1-type DNA replication protein [Methanosarcinales archaeon]MCD4767002.1 ORC1-type DNA replication protein [Methanosarcinales archaeon]
MSKIELTSKKSEKKPTRGIFDDFLKNTEIFENKEVLRPNYTPDNLPHRDKQIQSLASMLVPAIRGDTPSNILIYGKTGTGKTAVVKFMGQELQNTSESHETTCLVLYVNCEIVDTQYRLLATLAKHIGKEVPMTGWPTDQVFEEFKKTVDKEKRVVIIIMDEIDKLVRKGDDVLYNLSRINGDLENARISLIGISNDLKFTEFLDPRVKSSLGEEEIIFPPYDAEQIHDILEQRAGLAFKKGMLDETVTRLCAAFAAQEHGDARRALDLLRVSGEIAERTKSPVVEEKHVRVAQEKIENDRVVEVVRTLPTQSKLVLLSVLLLSKIRKNNVSTGEAYTVYKHMCNDIGSDILTQRRITDLISELDMLGIINAMVVSKGRYGRTKEISLSVPMSDTKGVLMEDYRLKPLENYQPDLLVVQSRLM